MIKPIMAVLIIIISLAVVIVLPFVLLHWALGLDLIYSILGTCAWAAFFLLVLLFRDVSRAPDKEDAP